MLHRWELGSNVVLGHWRACNVGDYSLTCELTRRCSLSQQYAHHQPVPRVKDGDHQEGRKGFWVGKNECLCMLCEPCGVVFAGAGVVTMGTVCCVCGADMVPMGNALLTSS